MLTLDRATVDAIVAHARADHPDEACGLVAMRDGRPTRVVPMTNVERSPTFYVMDSGELFRAFRDMRDRGEDDEEFVIYHSHTATEAYPSRTDVSIAAYPDAHYVLVSTRDPVDVELRSYRIVDGVVTEEEVVVA
ncbi:MAG TPA: M67 family metallopeptidase [Mycobacteriales bacterium]|jgi:proteasome lid subunit RPN8/RPN11|nr:M67 family metallopeptidase [Mycobacteriales bacterium]